MIPQTTNRKATLATAAQMQETQQDALRLGDVDDVVRAHPAFTTPAVRSLIHRSSTNGLESHIYRVGRKVLIDLNGFERWVREHGRAAA